jgi:hypothetical protein
LGQGSGESTAAIARIRTKSSSSSSSSFTTTTTTTTTTPKPWALVFSPVVNARRPVPTLTLAYRGITMIRSIDYNVELLPSSIQLRLWGV